MLNKRPTAGNINILFYLLHKRLPNSELPYWERQNWTNDRYWQVISLDVAVY